MTTPQVEHDGQYVNNHSPTANYMESKVESHEDALRHVRTAGTISLTPELFEKLYLSPQNAVKGELRKTFGNPTPMYV